MKEKDLKFDLSGRSKPTPHKIRKIRNWLKGIAAVVSTSSLAAGHPEVCGYILLSAGIVGETLKFFYEE